MPLAFEKPPSRAKKSREAKLARALLWARVKREVLKRDHFRCRACGSGDQVDAHHIKFRSVGGGDSTRNVSAMCRSCHDDIHAYRLAVVGDNANGKLRFVRRDGEMRGATRDIPQLPFQGSTPLSAQCSYAGAMDAKRRAQGQIWAYLRYLQQCGAQGSTDHEAAAALNLPIASVCARRNFWVGKRIISPSGKTRPGPTGTKNTVWVAAR